MKTFGKILGLFLLGLLLTLVALGFVLTHWFDPNDYKDEIRALARDKAKIDLTLNGDIGWSLFPWLGIELHDTQIASLQTPDQPLADLRLIGLSVRVLPLLRKEVQMSDIRIEGLTLNLERDAKGRANWENLGKAAPSSSPRPESQAPSTSTASNSNPEKPRQALHLDIDSLRINDARIHYQDRQKGQQYLAEGIELHTGAISENTDIPLKLTVFLSSNQPLLRARNELSATLRFDSRTQQYELQNAQLSGEASGEPFQGKTLDYSAQGQLLWDQAQGVAQWNNLKLNANQLRALGEVKLSQLNQQGKLEGALSIAPLDLRAFLQGIGQTLPATADKKALQHLELKSRLSGSLNSLMLDELELRLDDTQLTGSLGMADFKRQALRANLNGNQLNLDRYLPVPATDSPQAARQAEVKETVAAAGSQGTTAVPKAPTQQAWSSTAILPIAQLRKLDTHIELQLKSLTVNQLPLENLHLQFNSKGGTLNLQRLNGELQNGSFSSSGQLDVRGDTPSLTLRPTVKNIPIQLFIKAPEQQPPVRGLINLSSELSSRGNSQRDWVNHLNGQGQFSLNQGVLVDANLEQQLCRAIATLNRKALNSTPRSKDTPFQELKGNLQISNGVARTPNLRASIPGLSVKGDGALDLRVLGMDYRIGLIIEGDQQAMPDPACQVNERYVGIEWPLHCRGPLELGAKACRMDQEGLTKVATRLATNKLSEKIEEKLGDKASPELKEALKNLFKR